MSQPWKLSPSDLTFLWDECPRCFYLKVVHNITRPFTGFPKIFNRIDKLMKDFFAGKPMQTFVPALPPGAVQFGEKWVTSQPIRLSESGPAAFIKGKFDSVIAFDDLTYGVVDFKTSEASPAHVPFYSRQLQAYAYALQHPAQNGFALSPVSRLGLLCVEPHAMQMTPRGEVAYLGKMTWLECPNDEAQFLGFMDNVLTLLSQPEPPAPASQCAWCAYRQSVRESEF
jgi:hypothetical protein